MVERQAEFWGGREERSMLGLLIESSRRIPKLGFLKFLDYGYQNINDDVCAVFNKRLWEAVRTSDISDELGFDINEDDLMYQAFEILEQSESTDHGIGIDKIVSVSDLNVEPILEPDLNPEF